MENFSTTLDCNFYKGNVKIWQHEVNTGKVVLVRAFPNMILNGGADLLSQTLAGVKNTSISHMYIGYKNAADDSFDMPVIDKAYSNKFTSYGSGSYADFGYLRLPLAYSPSFSAQSGYTANVALYTSVIASADNYQGAIFRAQDYGGSDPSQIFEVALVAALDPTSNSQDLVFSRANFTPLLYNPNFNLTTTWGVQMLADPA